MTDIADLLPIATEALNRAHKIVLDYAPGAVTYKSDRDMATEVDYAVEEAVRAFLQHETPEIPFLGEEHGQTGDPQDDLVWVLDPVDGTVNLLHHVPLCAVSLSVFTRKQSVLGAVDLPFLGARYTAAQGHGATVNDRSIACSGTANMSNALISIGDYAVGDRAEEKNEKRLAVTATLAESAQRLRMLGAAAIDLVWVAEGRLDASVMLSNKPWDTGAGVLIAREAGAQVLDIDGTPHDRNSTATVAVNPELASALMDRLAIG